MQSTSISRRHVLASSLGLLSGSATWAQVAAARDHARQAVKSRQSFEYFDAATAGEIDALTAQIIPTDDTPGAHEAGVVYFIDRALATFDQDKRAAYRDGLVQWQAKRLELFPGSKSIASLSASDQVKLLHAVEGDKFFELLRFHTMLGFFGEPSYGGNRDGLGWKLIGFEGAHSYQQPFGFYDAQGGKK